MLASELVSVMEMQFPDEENVEPPTTKEVEVAIKKRNNNKSPGSAIGSKSKCQTNGV